MQSRLGFRARAGWLAHLLKAVLQQHHRELIGPFRPHIDPKATVLDVGAHAGQFSKLFARMAPQGQVFAFEPSAYARSLLAPALACNRIRNVEIIAQGLSDAPGSLTLSTPIKRRGGVGFGLAHLGEETRGGPVMTQTVALTTLDDFAGSRALSRLDFIKVDVEGWEGHVLQGGRQTLARFKPVLFLEIVAASLARGGSSPAQIWAQLEPLGYRALKAPDFTPTDKPDGDGDYLFVAADRTP